MDSYRLYCLDTAGKIVKVEEFEAIGDAEAMMAAMAMDKPQTCELWQHDKLIGKIPGRPETSWGFASI
jgi:hypothetical protein